MDLIVQSALAGLGISEKNHGQEKPSPRFDVELPGLSDQNESNIVAKRKSEEFVNNCFTH